MNKHFLKASIIGIFITNFTIAQDTIKCNDLFFKDTLIDKIIGNWIVSGDIGGETITYNFIANWELNHQFVELSFADTAIKPQYMAKVFIGYDCISERYVAHWLDNFGGRYSETLGYGKRISNSIEFRFEYPDGPFINKFIYNSKNDSWQFHTTTKNKKGNWVSFGDMYLQKVK
ncbi:MAG: hypothetical protein ACOYO1_07575 [Bacteroidales bacterium]